MPSLVVVARDRRRGAKRATWRQRPATAPGRWSGDVDCRVTDLVVAGNWRRAARPGRTARVAGERRQVIAGQNRARDRMVRLPRGAPSAIRLSRRSLRLPSAPRPARSTLARGVGVLNAWLTSRKRRRQPTPAWTRHWISTRASPPLTRSARLESVTRVSGSAAARGFADNQPRRGGARDGRRQNAQDSCRSSIQKPVSADAQILPDCALSVRACRGLRARLKTLRQFGGGPIDGIAPLLYGV